MAAPADLSKRARELVRAGKFCYKQGWVPATSGNFSARLDEARMAITMSGRHKGRLVEKDIIVADLDGNSLSKGKKPSAEALLHGILYRRDPAIGAVLHTHSTNATVLSLLHNDTLRLTDYEVLKAFPDIESHECRISVPIFPNDQDIPRLADRVDHYLDIHVGVHGYLIAGHGLYTWGSSVEDARRHIEAFEFLFACEVLLQRMSKINE